MLDREMVTCQCGKVMKYSDLEFHADECIKKTLTCPIPGCGIALTPEEANGHIDVCPKALMCCVLCNVTYTRENESAHANDCVGNITECQLCGKKIKRSAIDEHME